MIRNDFNSALQQKYFQFIEISQLYNFELTKGSKLQHFEILDSSSLQYAIL